MPSAQDTMMHAPYILVAILVIGHRYVLGCIVSLLLRIGLAIGLIRFQAKAKQIDSQWVSTNGDGQDTAAAASGCRAEIDSADLDVQISLLGVVLGTALGSSGALHRIQHEVAGRIAGAEVASNGHSDGSCRVKSITSVQIRRCRVGSIGVSVFPSNKRIVRNRDCSGADAPVGRALFALSIGGIRVDTRICVGLDSDGQRRDIAIDVAMQLGCVQIGIIPLKFMKDLFIGASGGEKTKNFTAGATESQPDPFASAASILSRVSPGFSLSGLCVTTNIQIPTRSPFAVRMSLEAISIWGDTDNHPTVNLGLQNLCIRVGGKGSGEAQDTSAVIRSIEFAVCRDDNPTCGGGAVIVRQRNCGVMLEAAVDLRSLEAVVASSIEAKVLLLAAQALYQTRKRGSAKKRTALSTTQSSRGVKSRQQKLVLGETMDVDLGIDVRVISAFPEDDAVSQTLTFSADANVRCSVSEAQNIGTMGVSDKKLLHCIGARSKTVLVTYSSGKSLSDGQYREDNILRICDARTQYVLDDSNAIEISLDSLAVDANEERMKLLARINRLAKSKSEGTPDFIQQLMSLSKKPPSGRSKGKAPPRIKVSCRQAQILVEGYARMDGLPIWPATYAISSNNTCLDITPKSPDDGHDVIDAKSEAFQAAVTIHPHGVLPLHPDALQTVKDVNHHDQSERPVTFTLFTTKAAMKASLASTSHRKVLDRIKAGPPSPHEEIEIYAETLVLDESFGHCRDCMVTNKTLSLGGDVSTRLVDTSKASILIDATRFDAGTTYPRCLVRNIRIDTAGPSFRGTWSPILQQYIGLIEQTTKATIKRYQNMFKTKPPSSPAVDIVNVSINITKSLLDVRLHMGHKSVLDLTAQSLKVDVTNNPKGLWKKQSIQVWGRGLTGHINEFAKEVFSVDELRFEDVMRHATIDEVESYNRKIDASNAIDMNDDVNAVVSDINGQPIMEEFGVHIGGTLRVNVPPVLHLGEVIDDFSNNAKTMFMALRQARLQRPKSKQIYQLMKISASIPFLDASLLEPTEKGKESPTCVGADIVPCLDMMRLTFEELVLSVERLTPPSSTQARLCHLDEDKKHRYRYGPSIQGGETKFSVRHAVCLIHPLTIATPLVRLDDFQYNGLYLMASLDPNTEGLVERAPYGYLFNCHHRSVKDLALPAEALLCRPSACGCRYGVSVSSSSAPPKMFFDGTIALSGLDFSYGMCVLSSIPALMDIIKRVQPPPSPNSAPAGPIGWWDNLRFLIHGNIRLSANRLCTRFLLDTPARHDWAIMLQCRNYVLDYKTSVVATSMNHGTLTVPGLAYHATLNESSANNDTPSIVGLSAALGLDSKGGRHSLLLIPRLAAKFGLHWIVKCPEKSKSIEHHAPYLMEDSLSTFLSDDSFALLAADKFHRFRSHGVNLDVSLELEANDRLNNWLALRVDVLPWLTHKVLSAIPPPSEREEDGPGPIPKIERLSINAKAADIHLACWFDDDDEEEKKDGGAQTNRNSDGVCLMIPTLTADFVNTGDTHVQMEGLIQAALLDIDYDSFYGAQLSSSGHMIDNIGEAIKACDHAVGSFAAARGIGDASEALEVAPDLGANFDSPSREDEAAHVIFHRLQQWARNISALDSVFVVDRIDILSTPLHKLMANARETSDRQILAAQNHSSSHHSLSSISQKPLWHETQTPWTVLVGGLKILWTLEIRDALLSLSQDLRFTLDYMKLALRTMPSKQKDAHEDDRGNVNHDMSMNGAALSSGVQSQSAEQNGDEDNASQSSDELDLDYLLGDSSLAHLVEEEKDKSSSLQKPSLSRNISVQEARKAASDYTNRSIGSGAVNKSGADANVAKNATIPTLDVHLSNPQFQLHSDQTGGSVILAMRGAYIDGQRYLNLIDPDNLLNAASTSIDSLLQKTELQYTLDRMEIYAITPGVEVDAGLQWLDYTDDAGGGDGDGFGADDSQDANGHRSDEDELPSILPSLSVQGGSIPELPDTKLSSRRHFQPRFGNYDPKTFHKPPLMQLIMNRCTFDSRQVFHRNPHHLSSDEIAAYVRRGHLEPLLESALDQVDLHIDEMSFMLDSHQYITTFDLIRNVLLEPPKVSNRRERQLFVEATEEPSDQKDELQDEAEKDEATARVEGILDDWNERFPRLKDGVHRQRKRIRQQLRNASQKLMVPLEQQHLLSRNTSNRKIKYTLGKLKWQIRSPDYLDEVTIDFTGFRGQHEFIADGAVLSNISLEDFQVTTASPGPDALAFYDPFVILACEVQGENPCTRCGKVFNRATNSARSCVHHAGSFTAGWDDIKYWTCCGSRLRDAPGCVARPHSGREKAAVVRIETLPSPTNGLRLYKHLEINFYPNVQHTIVVQITKDLSNLFMAYFLGADDQLDGDDNYVGDSDDDEESTHQVRSARSELGSDDLMDDASSVSQTSSAALPMTQSHNAASSSSSRSRRSKRSALFGGRRGSDRGSGSRKRRSSRHQEGVVSAVEPPEIDGSVSHPPQEIAFIKYWRIGNIDASLSVSGFAVDTTDLGILIPSYSKAYKCGRNNYLGRKYISHLVHEIVRSAASSGMQKMKRKFRLHSRSRSSADDRTSRRARTASGAAAAARAGSFEAAREDFLLGGGSIAGGGPKQSSARSHRRRLYTT